MKNYESYFSSATGHASPRAWQAKLALDEHYGSRLIRIPTGLGKTLGVLGGWAYHRLEQKNAAWPRRLVWCLPMRTLTEQTSREARAFLDAAGHTDVDVHTLMGGEDAGDWTQHPEREAVLVGTQDMLLSAALNRGYGMGRAAWPRAMGLLHTDCLWVMDEVQLMDVGLATSGQLQAFWDTQPADPFLGACDDASSRPRATWWMSATLQPEWLRTPETDPDLGRLIAGITETAPSEQTGPAWDARKPVRCVEQEWDASAWADLVLEGHDGHDAGPDGSRQTLVVVNRVAHAQALYDALQKIKGKGGQIEGTDVRLIHSRFRPQERARWSKELLRRPGVVETPADRILVATQVVEAGVDISATHMVTALAPWPSLVQRFGRAARWGGAAAVTVVLDGPAIEKDPAPYASEELAAAAVAVRGLKEAGLASLLSHEEAMDAATVATLYPYRPAHVLIQKEWEELFDTSAGLSGGDLDVGRFIRSGEDRDVLVFWRDWHYAEDGKHQNPPQDWRPRREEVCRVPLGKNGMAGWLAKLGSHQAYRWDYADGRWEMLRAESRLSPGSLIVVRAAAGGYDPVRGYVGHQKKTVAVPIVEVPDAVAGDAQQRDDRQQAGDALSGVADRDGYQTIATHGRLAGKKASGLAAEAGFGARLTQLIDLTLRLHDWGKAHPAFVGCYGVHPPRSDLAKAPEAAWVHFKSMYRMSQDEQRRGFRHELASALGLLGWLRAADPWHPALLGPFRQLAEAGAFDPEVPDADAENAPPPNPLLTEVRGLTAEEFDLVLYLLAAHHGKVRGALTPTDQDHSFRSPADAPRVLPPVRGVCTGDRLPSVKLCDAEGAEVTVPVVRLDADLAGLGLSPKFGRSWSDRVGGLVASYGPFRLGYLEALVRAADVCVSREIVPDERLAGVSLTPAPPVSLGNQPLPETAGV